MEQYTLPCVQYTYSLSVVYYLCLSLNSNERHYSETVQQQRETVSISYFLTISFFFLAINPILVLVVNSVGGRKRVGQRYIYLFCIYNIFIHAQIYTIVPRTRYNMHIYFFFQVASVLIIMFRILDYTCIYVH